MPAVHPVELARQIINGVSHIVIASVNDDGSPWNTPVYAAFDDQYNFYWTSHETSQHSANVRRTGQAFICVFDSTGSLGNKTGVYLECEAKELHQRSEIEHARTQTQARKGLATGDIEPFLHGPRRVYRALPSRVWINDAEKQGGEFIKDFRIEVSLKDLLH